MRALLLDEMYPPALGERLRSRRHDVVAVLDDGVGLAAQPDESVLAYALESVRVVVTENVQDFARLVSTHPHAGVVLVSRVRFPRTGSGLHRLEDALAGWSATDAEETSPLVWL